MEMLLVSCALLFCFFPKSSCRCGLDTPHWMALKVVHALLPADEISTGQAWLARGAAHTTFGGIYTNSTNNHANTHHNTTAVIMNSRIDADDASYIGTWHIIGAHTAPKVWELLTQRYSGRQDKSSPAKPGQRQDKKKTRHITEKTISLAGIYSFRQLFQVV